MAEITLTRLTADDREQFVLDNQRAFKYGAMEEFGERDSHFEYATLYEHLCRAIDRSMHRIGIHGLPLMGCGDWNDGMSLVGVEGKGESVWVAFFLADLLPKMEQLTQMMPGADLSYCSELADFRARLVKALQDNAWDGAWFLRAYFDNGDPMGSRNNTECQIDLISQAWSILTDVATEKQKESIFRETDYRLVNREHEIIQLLTPPFQHSQNNPGYIMRYPVGIRENGGQYTHGAMWYIMAQLKEGRTDMAYFLYSLINPIHRTATLADVLKYKVEPYCIAADIYSNPQHPGRGGWTWYTGSASWAYKTGIENILGLSPLSTTTNLTKSPSSLYAPFSPHCTYSHLTAKSLTTPTGAGSRPLIYTHPSRCRIPIQTRHRERQIREGLRKDSAPHQPRQQQSRVPLCRLQAVLCPRLSTSQPRHRILPLAACA